MAAVALPVAEVPPGSSTVASLSGAPGPNAPAGPGALAGIDALLAEAIRAGALPEGLDALQRTRGFHVEPGSAVRDLAGIAAHASNSAGLIVGEAPVAGGSHAMIWQAGADPRDLGDLPGGETAAVARAINETGQIVGQGSTDAGPRAFLWEEASGLRDLNDLAAPASGTVLTDATGIDGNGRVIGRAMVDGVPHAFVWTPATATLDIADAAQGTGQDILDLRAIGTDGLAVGRALSEDGRDRPVAWFPGGEAFDLGDLPGGSQTGVAYDIDGLEWIVGRSGAEDGDRAFVWQADAGMVDLNDLIEDAGDVVLTGAVSIIDDGQILAYGRDGEEVRFYRLTPVVAPYAGQQVGLVAEKGVTDLQSYRLTDLGQFVGPDTLPILAMDESGRVVGACDLLATACPYLTDLAGITNFFEEEPLPDGPIFAQVFPPQRSSGNGVGTQLTPNRGPSGGGGGGGGFPTFGGGGGGGGDDGGGGGGGNPDFEFPDGPGAGIEPPPAAVPLPAAWFSLLAALGLLGAVKRRRGGAV